MYNYICIYIKLYIYIQRERECVCTKESHYFCKRKFLSQNPQFNLRLGADRIEICIFPTTPGTSAIGS